MGSIKRNLKSNIGYLPFHILGYFRSISLLTDGDKMKDPWGFLLSAMSNIKVDAEEENTMTLLCLMQRRF